MIQLWPPCWLHQGRRFYWRIGWHFGGPYLWFHRRNGHRIIRLGRARTRWEPRDGR